MPTKGRAKAELPFNPEMFRWAREKCGQTIAAAAEKLGLSPSVVQTWETGLRAPTVRQARLLADFYKRPFLEFFYDTPPEIVESPLVPDFRMHRGAPSPKEGGGLHAIQLWAETQRLNALDLYDELGEAPPDFPPYLTADLRDQPDDIAALARTAVHFPIEVQTSLSSLERDNLPKILRSKLEQIGVLVLRDSSLGRHMARGLCIAEFPLPIIVFGREAPGAQAFTMIHELGHVLLRQSAISGSVPRSSAKSPGRDVEHWCNQFAAAFLVPADALNRKWARPNKAAPEIDDSALRKLARMFGVSPHAMLVRLVHLNYVLAQYYWENKRPQFDEEEADYAGGGRSEYYGSRFRSANGDLYTGLVLEAWTTGRITGHNAGEFMGITNLQHLYDIRDHYGF
jgi:Zn-dependent peptidase ImmA (M78 family)/transcriptional regulator with XRE-family HTH domain